MSTMIPNNREQALSQLGNYADVVEAKIPKEINELEKGYYHVAIVTRQHLPEQETYNTYVNIQKFRPEVWERYSREEKDGTSAFKRAGIKSMYIFHNPTKKVEEEKKYTAEEVKALIDEAGTIEEIENLIKDENRKTVVAYGEKKISELND